LNFKKNGWFKNYLKFREDNPFDLNFPTKGIKLHENLTEGPNDEALYAFLQPTGILYGFPLSLPFQDMEFPNQKYFDDQDTGLLVFLESLYACLLFESQKVGERGAFKDFVKPTMDYFLRVHDPFFKQRKKLHGIFSKGGKIDLYYRFEKVLKKRIHVEDEGSGIAHYFSNSLILIDLYYALIWQRKQREEGGVPEFKDINQQVQDLHKTLLEIVIAASHANNIVEKEEKKIFEQILRSADLDKENIRDLKSKFKEGRSIEDLQISNVPWLIKRFFLEMAMMTVLSDDVYEKSESRFIADLSEKLDLKKEDLDQSQLAVETFLFTHRKYLSLSKRKTLFLKIASKWKTRVSKLMLKNKDRMIKEMSESKELYQLLLKSKSQKLTIEEKEKVRVQLLDILKAIPPVVIIALPGTFITLPVMLSVMPKNMLPSSFQED
jgi:LETM1-like, RBD